MERSFSSVLSTVWLITAGFVVGCGCVVGLTGAGGAGGAGGGGIGKAGVACAVSCGEG